MTESQWLTTADPKLMIDWLYQSCGPLFTATRAQWALAGLLRRIWSRVPRMLHNAVTVVEQMAEGTVGRGKIDAAVRQVRHRQSSRSRKAEYEVWIEETMLQALRRTPDLDVRHGRVLAATLRCSHIASDSISIGHYDGQKRATAYHQEAAAQCTLLRCLFGNPLRPVALHPKVERLGPGGFLDARGVYRLTRCPHHPHFAGSYSPLDHEGHLVNPWRGSEKRTCTLCWSLFVAAAKPAQLTEADPAEQISQRSVSLAQAAYQGRQEDWTLDPGRLGILADSLEDDGLAGPTCWTCHGEGTVRQEHAAGEDWATEWQTCPDCRGEKRWPQRILHHLRQPDTPHYAGCWAVEFVLRKGYAG